MTKPRICISDSVGLGLIIECASGVLVSNQTGGVQCIHPEVEGVFLPLRNDYAMEGHVFRSPELDLAAQFSIAAGGSGLGLQIADAEFIEAILARERLHPTIVVDRARLDESHEAWVHVKISADEADDGAALFCGFDPYPRLGVLTWANSD